MLARSQPLGLPIVVHWIGRFFFVTSRRADGAPSPGLARFDQLVPPKTAQ